MLGFVLFPYYDTATSLTDSMMKILVPLVTVRVLTRREIPMPTLQRQISVARFSALDEKLRIHQQRSLSVPSK